MDTIKPNFCKYCKKEVDSRASKCPHCHSDLRNWIARNPIKFFFLFLFVIVPFFSLVISGVGDTRSKVQSVADETVRQQRQSEHPAIFDISNLLDKSIDEVVTKLGQPKSKYVPKGQIDGDTPDMTFEKDGLQMIVTYDLKTKKVIDFFLPSASEHSSINNKEDKNIILNQLNLSDKSPDYEVKYIIALKDPNIFTGVIVKKIDPLASKKETRVKSLAKDLIEASLKAPSTAKFGYATVKTTDGKTFVVSQSVDSQNGFGAMIKTYFDVTIKYIGLESENAIYENYNWKVIKVEGI